MFKRKVLARLLTSVAFALALPSSEFAVAQSSPTIHNMVLSNATETIDGNGRRVFVSKVDGDLPGYLTLALVVGPNGVVSGGEWALTVSYIRFGPPDPDGDGDPSEAFIQRGVIKGVVSGGAVVLADTGLATDLTGVQLHINGATVEFSSVTSGTGSVAGSRMNQQPNSNGYLTITF